MCAGVDESANAAILLADDEDRLLANVGGIIVAMLCDLALMAEIDPDFPENPIHLSFEHNRVSVEPPVDPEDTIAGAVVNKSCSMVHAA